MNWIVLEIGQRVVHPTHVPLQAEPETAEMSGPRNHGVGGRLLRVGLNVRMLFVSFEVEAAQEVDGFQVLAPAELVRNPFILLARVVEIEHGSDGVNAKAVGMIFVQPEHGARHEEAAHFAATAVKDESLPIGMEALA